MSLQTMVSVIFVRNQSLDSFRNTSVTLKCFFFTDRLILSQKRKLEKIEYKWMHSRQILTSFNGKTQKRRPSIFKHTVYQ